MRLVLIVIVLVACGRGDPREACPARAHELGAWLEQVRVEGNGAWIAGMDALAELAAAPALADPPRFGGNVLEIHANGAVFAGRPIADVDDPLADPALRDRDHPARVLIAIDGPVPLADVVPLVDRAARAGLTDASFAVTRRSSMKPPPPSSLTPKIDALLREPAGPDKATRFARLMSGVVAPCPALREVFGSVAVVDDKARTIVAGVEPALIACDCKGDLDALRSGMWSVLGPGPGGKVTTTIAVTLAPSDDAAATPITGATWADAAPALLAAKGTRVKLVARAPSR
jgi:hypothetical protein